MQSLIWRRNLVEEVQQPRKCHLEMSSSLFLEICLLHPLPCSWEGINYTLYGKRCCMQNLAFFSSWNGECFIKWNFPRMEKDADSVVGWGDWAFSASHEDLTCFGQGILPFHASQLMHSSICPISFTSLSRLPFSCRVP